MITKYYIKKLLWLETQTYCLRNNSKLDLSMLVTSVLYMACPGMNILYTQPLLAYASNAARGHIPYTSRSGKYLFIECIFNKITYR